MWEIENNPDVLALDKDPKAEQFLCDIYETVNPDLKVSEFGDADPSVEKVPDVENPEIHDVEGIMNLEECEWNEIFTIEEQEIKNHACTSADVISNTGVIPNNRSQVNREAKSLKSKISNQLSTDKSPVYSRKLYLAALNSNCKVIVEKISIDSINYVIEKFGSTRSKSENNTIPKIIIKRTHENVADNKSKKAKSSSETEKLDKKSQYLIEQRRLFNLTKTPMSTINKNSVSRIIDAITIDSDDNQSCIIVNSTKSKTENTDNTKNQLKSKSKLVKSSKPSIESDKTNDKPLANLSINRSTSKTKHLKIKLDKKKDKRDWVDKNVKETPVTYENFFNNKKLSILGSGFKISKKTTIQSDKVENELDDQWSEAKKPVDEPETTFDTHNDDDDDDDCLWPKEKDQYDDGQKSKKDNDVEESDWPKEKYQNPSDNDKTQHPINNSDYNDDDDCGWPKENQNYDDYNDNIKPTVESDPELKAIKLETKDTSPTADDIDVGDDESNQKWYGGGDNESDNEEAANAAKSRDPWSRIISKSIKPEFLDDFNNSNANDVIEIDDDSEFGDPLKAIVKNEMCNPPKKGYDNVWSRIQEFHNSFDNSESANAIPFNPEDMVLDSVDETLKNMNYIKDAKWLNSKNEDFLDSYTEPIDCREPKRHGKWYNDDDRHRRHSPPQVISLMDIDLNRNKKLDFISTEPYPVAESWVDSDRFKSYKNTGNKNNTNTNNNRSHSRMSPKSSRANFVSPNLKQTSFQNMTLEQLFPPFKKEYFKNTNNFESSPEQSPNWHDSVASSNHMMKSRYSHMASGYCNGPMAGQMTPHDDSKYAKPKLSPRGASFPIYDINGSSYPKGVPPNGYLSNDIYNAYGPTYSKMSSYPFYGRAGMVPNTPDSPDQAVESAHIDPFANCGPPSFDQSRSFSQCVPATAGKSNGSTGVSAQPPYKYAKDGNSHLPPQPPYQDMNAYYYPYYGPPFTQPYGNLNQFHPFSSYEQISYTPASPEPEEKLAQEPPKQIG